MVEAVRTTASTFAIWAIVVVAVIVLAAWLVGVYVADGYQTRLSRLRRRMDAPGPALSGAGVPAQAGQAAAAASIPGQRRDAGQPAQEPQPESVAARQGRPARDLAQTDFRRDGPLTEVEAELGKAAPTRSQRPAQADAPTRPDLPAQRSGDADRAEPAMAGPDPDRGDDQDGE